MRRVVYRARTRITLHDSVSVNATVLLTLPDGCCTQTGSSIAAAAVAMFTAVVSSVGETNVVGSGEPFQTITLPSTKPVPCNDRVKLGAPSAAVFGTSAAIVGGGVVVS